MQHETLIQIERLVGRAENPLNRELLSLMRKMVGRIDTLEGQVESLGSALSLDKTANVQSAFGLSKNLAQLLILLSDSKPRNKEVLHAALYYDHPDSDMPEVKIIDTLICKIRPLMRQHGVEIGTVWGNGYRLTAGEDVVMAAIESAEPTSKIISLVAVR